VRCVLLESRPVLMPMSEIDGIVTIGGIAPEEGGAP
jgi:hypothetical protein